MTTIEEPARILVVDDEPDLELLIKQRFRNKIRNNEVTFDFAANGVIALEKLKSAEKEYDMILTDINMPEMDGLTLLVKIKEQFGYFKAVVVSAYGDMENIRSAMNRGAFDFITKPIDFTDLETTIDKTLAEIRFVRQGQLATKQLDQSIRDKEKAELEKVRAEQSEKFKQQFLANMSHEIRTPMNSIIGLSNLVIKTNLDEVQRKYLNVIRKSSENLLVIINDILDLSKIEAGKMEFEKVPFSLEDALETFYHAMLFKTEEKNLSFKINIAEDTPKVLIGDTTRLIQVLINLTGNAIKFTEKGGVIVDIRPVRIENNSCTLLFSINDTGIGISQVNLGKIFDSFSQASSDTTRKYGGTGLGLTISKQLVEMQGGEINVTSTPGKGTTFSFTIPYEIGDETAETKDEKHIGVSPEELRGIKILLVEDNAFNQMVATDTLTDLIGELSIDVAENGRIAVDMVSKNEYDVVLMDIQMPEMDGFESTKNIRQLPGTKGQTRIMAMTANVTPEEVSKCFECGMNEYISKPFDPQDLINKLGKLVNENQL
jgi:signal transduction histidine kinase